MRNPDTSSGFLPACRRFLVLNHCAFLPQDLSKNLRLTCRIGAYETERSASQSVVFNADIWVRFSASSSQRDALEDVLNYDLAVEIFREESSRGHIDLQETLVDRIAERLSNLPGVELIRISSEKTEAYDDADAIGVEVWRSGSPLLT